jgi:hypothetical protein
MTPEKPAKGVKGFIMVDLISDKTIFRVYGPEKGQFKDYEIHAEDFEVEITDDSVVLKDEAEVLDWSSDILGTSHINED